MGPEKQLEIAVTLISKPFHSKRNIRARITRVATKKFFKINLFIYTFNCNYLIVTHWTHRNNVKLKTNNYSARDISHCHYVIM